MRVFLKEINKWTGRKTHFLVEKTQFTFQSEAKLNHEKGRIKNVVQDIKFNCQPLLELNQIFCTLISMFIQVNQGTQFRRTNRMQQVFLLLHFQQKYKNDFDPFCNCLPFYSAFFFNFCSANWRQSGISSLINISAASIKHFFILFMKIISFWLVYFHLFYIILSAMFPTDYFMEFQQKAILKYSFSIVIQIYFFRFLVARRTLVANNNNESNVNGFWFKHMWNYYSTLWVSSKWIICVQDFVTIELLNFQRTKWF